ncbi:MAG: hypothetical protein ACI9U2_000213 [Bradymonadia bacterium]|jgi:hypothetical protein
MRWLFIGIAAMALGLVAVGTLSRGNSPSASKLMEVSDRFVELIVDAPASTGKATSGGKQATGRPMARSATVDKIVLAPSMDEGKRAGDGDFGKEIRLDKAGFGRAIGAASARRSGSRRMMPAHEKAPQVVVEEAQDIEEDDLFADDAQPIAPPPPPSPRMVAKPASGAAKAAYRDALQPVEDAKRRVLVTEAKTAQAFQFAPDLAEGEQKDGYEAGAVNSKTPYAPRSKRGALNGQLDGMFAANVEQGEDGRLPARLDLSLLGTSTTQSSIQEAPPAEFLQRMCYFENTYLGGNAAWQEQLRRVRKALGHLRPLQHARLDTQAFDPPADAGMALTASLDHGGLQQPGRVVLQVGLQGSQRYGWRRPPLDVVLVVDGPATDLTQAATKALLDRLGPRDRLGVIEAGSDRPLAAVADLRTTRDALIDHETRAPSGSPATLVRAMDQAGALLAKAANNSARIPGSQTVVLLTRDSAAHAQAARAAAHRLQTQGAVVSVVDLGSTGDAGWWAVANAGHGNFHQTRGDTLGEAFDAELAMLSKVVARLLRVNVRLGPHTEGVRVIGSRILGKQEVTAVKAREKATDRNLSKTMGVKANRGDDDDGIQTVIPYFYGGDSHVILIELWVDPSKGSFDAAVAEITLKYKDMVNLDNATARAAVFLNRRPTPDTRAQRLVKANLDGFAFADALDRAAQQASQGQWPAVKQTLRNHAHTARDRQVVDAFEALIGQRSPAQLQQALTLASQQRKGTSNGVDP